MKTLYIIGGPMGVGKTTVSQALKKKLPDCVFLDGDWCWDADPFQVTEATKALVMDNIIHILTGFLRCSAYKNVVFCWVLHMQNILDEILSALPEEEYRVVCISLVCRKEILVKRLQGDVQAGLRTADVIERSILRLPLYDRMQTTKIDVSEDTVEETVERILRI